MKKLFHLAVIVFLVAVVVLAAAFLLIGLLAIFALAGLSWALIIYGISELFMAIAHGVIR